MVNIDTSCCSCGIRGACEKGSQWQSALSLLKAAGLPGRKNCRKRPSKHSKNDGDIRWGTFTFSWSIIVTIRFGVCWKEAFMISFAVAEASGMFTFLVLVYLFQADHHLPQQLEFLQCQPAQGPLLPTSAGLEGGR